MFNLEKLRLPYREDRLFGFLFFIALIIPLAFSVYNYESFEVIKFGLFALLTGAALMVTLKSPGYIKHIFRGGKIFYTALALFWFWAFMATVFAWDKNYAFFGFYARFTNGFIFYSLWSILLLLLGLMDWEKIKTLLKILVFCSGLVAIYGLLQSLGIGFYLGLTTDFFNRSAVSFLGNPDFSSMFVVALLPLTAIFLYKAGSFKSKIYYSLNIFFQLWSLAIFASRGALLALVVGLGLAGLMALLFKKRGLKLFLVFLVIAFLAFGLGKEFLNFARPNAVQITLSGSDPNINYRLGVWKLSWQSMLKRPLTGVGLGNFELMFEHDRTNKIIDTGFFDDAHNLPLELGVTGGFPLLILFLFLAGWAVFSGIKSLFADFSPEIIGIIASIAAWFTAAMFTPVAIPCYVLLAFLISACFTPLENAIREVGSQDGWFWKLRRPNAVVGSLTGFKEVSGSISPDVTNNKFIKLLFPCLGVILILYGSFFITAEFLFYAGVRSYNAGRYSQGYNFTTVAILLNPVNRLYYVYQVGSAIRAGQTPAKVENILKRMQKLNSDSSLSYFQDANLYYLLLCQTQNLVYKQPIMKNINKAVQLDPFNSNSYLLRAQFELVFGDLVSAQNDAQKGLEISPQNLDDWIFLARIYQIEGNKSEMVSALSQALKNDPGNAGLVKAVGLAKNISDISKFPLKVNLSVGSLQ